MLNATIEGIAQNMGHFKKDSLAVVIIIDGLFIMDKSVSDFLERKGDILLRKKTQLVFDFQNFFIFREVLGVFGNSKFKAQIDIVIEKLLILFRRAVLLKRERMFSSSFEIVLKTLRIKLHKLEHSVFLKDLIKNYLKSSSNQEVDKLVKERKHEDIDDARPRDELHEINFKKQNEFREFDAELDKLFGILESDLVEELEDSSQRG